MQAVREERHEDVCFDALVGAVEDRAHRQIVFEFLEQRAGILPVNIPHVR
jgi:hypothetical protein